MSNNKSVLPKNEPHCRSDIPVGKTKRYTEFGDNELLTLIGTSRDRVALCELYNRYQLPLARFLERQMRGTLLIEEVYNDVMLTVWKKADSFRGDSKVSTWLFGIAYRTRLTHYRKESRHNHVGTDELLTNVATQEQPTETEPQTAINESLHAALTELSVPHRAVIELAYFHGYNIAEIAKIVNVPQNTVKTRLFHARKKLKDVIEADQTCEVETTNGKTSERSLKTNRNNPKLRAHPLFGHCMFVAS